jgi:hypothetical protein
MKNTTKRLIATYPYISIFLFLLFFIFFTNGPSDESWGYWLSAKKLWNGEGFPIFGRSPLYAFYLMFFIKIPFPYSFFCEFFFTNFIFCISIYLLFSKLYSKILVLIFTLLSLPYILSVEPLTIHMSLTCVFCAFYIRFFTKINNKIILFYFLLFLSMNFRINFLIFFLIYLIYDIFKINNPIISIKFIKKIFLNRFFFICYFFLILVYLFQDSSVTNNAYSKTTTWFPYNTKSLSQSATIQGFNQRYIQQKLNSDYKNNDIYFTHKEAFYNGKNIYEMFYFNPKLTAEILLINIRSFFNLSINNFKYYDPLEKVNYNSKSRFVLIFFAILFFYYLFLKTLLSLKNLNLKIFLLGCFLTSFTTILVYPKIRYLLTLLPIYLAIFFFLQNKVTNSFIFKKNIFIFFLLLFFSLYSISYFAHQLVANKKDEKYYLMKSYIELKKNLNNCKNGIITSEPEFFSAILFNNKNIYDIFEIPPFGNFYESKLIYNGLNFNRIDCVAISDINFSYNGKATSTYLRYKNYLLPYTQLILDNGGFFIRIEGYGNLYKIN